MELNKLCLKCRHIKSITLFNKSKRENDGHHYYCKECCSSYWRNYLKFNPKCRKSRKEYSKKKYIENAELYKRKSKEWFERNKDTCKIKGRNYHLKIRFKLSQDQFDKILISQGNKCAICESVHPKGRGTWHIDHDHKCCDSHKTCGKCIRGLLCSDCNLALGRFKDIESIVKFIEYLRNPPALKVLKEFFNKKALNHEDV